VVEVQYDPDEVSYSQLIDLFFSCHDPTQLNRQGPDVGYQYRSVIFFHNADQERQARDAKQRLDAGGSLARKAVTRIEPASRFWKAEEYHQQYLEKRGVDVCH